ncbi:DUF3089 domain-containing protein [Allosphingosinicella vermicomposti]|uniref:DUF3089 domain-containing protein n=1 Tax=Allosphingosinicella vermicomposti TaxID=614671 RepID=UPI000D10A220|nr:DUF3089 domain-containing protein [Allosphingosinicella vermicomposti]
MARRFLWIIAIFIILLLAGALGYRLLERPLMRAALVPSAPFEAVPQPGVDYRPASMWIARPDVADNPALWLPDGFADQPAAGNASVFFIHPTSYLDRSRWNSPMDDADSQQRARLFVRSQASIFNGVGAIWAPKYRQATFGAFLTNRADAAKALDFAYRDVLSAYEEFVRQAPADKPIILAGHSQGSLHLTRLLAERVKGSPEAARVAAIYAVGWPVSISVDLPRFGFPACATPDQTRCLISWQSFAEPAGTDMVTDIYDASNGSNGRSRAGTPMVCTNPLTGAAGGTAKAEANLGTLEPNGDLSAAGIVKAAVPARCDARGFLLIGEDAPELGPYVLPGNNYHVFDYALFWANARADVARRLAAFTAQ